MALKRALAAFLLVAATAFPAAAQTIYFAGTEDIDFVVNTGTFSTSSNCNTGNCRSAYVNEALQITGSTSDPPTNSIVSPNFGNQTSLWFHAQFLGPTSGSTSANSQVFSFYGSDGVRRLSIRGTGTAGQVKISTRNAAGTFVDLVTCSSGTFPDVTQALTALDVNVNYSASGSITLYKNGTQFCTYSGNLETDSNTSLAYLELSGPGSTSASNWSEDIVASSDSRALALQLLKPQAAGTTQQWSGAVVGNIAKNSISDSTWNSTPTNSQTSNWTVPSLVAGTWSVVAVKQNARVAIGASGPQHFAFSYQGTGGSGVSATQNPTTSFANYGLISTINPATSAAWVASDITGGNFGIESLP